MFKKVQQWAFSVLILVKLDHVDQHFNQLIDLSHAGGQPVLLVAQHAVSLPDRLLQVGPFISFPVCMTPDIPLRTSTKLEYAVLQAFLFHETRL